MALQIQEGIVIVPTKTISAMKEFVDKVAEPQRASTDPRECGDSGCGTPVVGLNENGPPPQPDNPTA
jgi:hypothetical protein